MSKSINETIKIILFRGHYYLVKCKILMSISLAVFFSTSPIKNELTTATITAFAKDTIIKFISPNSILQLINNSMGIAINGAIKHGINTSFVKCSKFKLQYL